jgi:hypothetical protein
MARRNGSSITSLLSDIVDDIRDFVDDEIVDRGRDTERDLRKAGRNWTDSDEEATSNRSDVNELAKAVAALSAKVDALSAEK